MPILCTIGYGNNQPDVFLERIKAAGIDLVIDVRREGCKAWHGKYNHKAIGKWLERCGIRWVAIPSLANESHTLAEYIVPRQAIKFTARFIKLCTDPFYDRDFSDRRQAPCILCAELDPNRCHRKLVAEALVKELGKGWGVKYL